MVSDSSYYTLEYHHTAGRVRFSCAMMLFIHIIQHSQRLFCSEILYMGGTNVSRLTVRLYHLHHITVDWNR
jgi:hypothetical protein